MTAWQDQCMYQMESRAGCLCLCACYYMHKTKSEQQFWMETDFFHFGITEQVHSFIGQFVVAMTWEYFTAWCLEELSYSFCSNNENLCDQ